MYDCKIYFDLYVVSLCYHSSQEMYVNNDDDERRNSAMDVAGTYFVTPSPLNCTSFSLDDCCSVKTAMLVSATMLCFPYPSMNVC